MNTMKNKWGAFLSICVVLIFFSVLAAFYNFYLEKNYTITAKVPCNPEFNSCFTESCENSNLICVYPDNKVYFKVIHKNGDVASPINLCEYSGECEAVYCNDLNLEELEAESCSE